MFARLRSKGQRLVTADFPNACSVATAPDMRGPVLVVDDEPSVTDIICRWLRAEGYQCASAASVEEAWSVLADGSFALLVTDIRMPGKSGIELLAMVNERFPNLAVIMVTVLDERKTAVRALHLGAYGYLTKPFTKTEIIIHVVSALQRRKLVMAHKEHELRLEQAVHQQTAHVRHTEEEIALRLVATAAHRDDETSGHIRRIGLYAEVLAGKLGWGPQAIHDIRVAAPMHDVGKIGVPDSILLKPGMLTADEFEVVKKHAEIGAQILDGSEIGLFHTAKDIALSHHERWDGAGYPQGLAGCRIPVSARLVAIADVYDCLLQERVYRSAVTEEAALTTMTRNAEGHFDPEIFPCFLDVLPEFRRIRAEVPDEASCDEAS